MKTYNFKLIISSLFISILGLSAEVDMDRAANTVVLDEMGVKNLRINTVEADEQEFETTVFAIGRIEEIPASRSVLSSRIAGRIVKLNAFIGDTVSEGQILAAVESRQIGNPPPTIELKAPQNGVIIDSHVRLGQPVEPEAELLDITDRSQMWAIAKIPEQEAANVRIGSTAHIRIPALGKDLIDAKLIRFGVVADRQAGTVEGIFEIDNSDGRLSPGMRAEFSIVLSSRSDVLSVPLESIQGDPANRVVFVRDYELANAFIRVPVVLGEQNESHVEILSGLFPGDEVVVRGSYSLGFAGGGSGISLKEALDAAHGHDHNEDGSEKKTEGSNDGSVEDAHEHDGDLEYNSLNRGLIVFASAMALLSAILAQALRKKSKKSEEK